MKIERWNIVRLDAAAAVHRKALFRLSSIKVEYRAGVPNLLDLGGRPNAVMTPETTPPQMKSALEAARVFGRGVGGGTSTEFGQPNS